MSLCASICSYIFDGADLFVRLSRPPPQIWRIVRWLLGECRSQWRFVKNSRASLSAREEEERNGGDDRGYNRTQNFQTQSCTHRRTHVEQCIRTHSSIHIDRGLRKLHRYKKNEPLQQKPRKSEGGGEIKVRVNQLWRKSESRQMEHLLDSFEISRRGWQRRQPVAAVVFWVLAVRFRTLTFLPSFLPSPFSSRGSS